MSLDTVREEQAMRQVTDRLVETFTDAYSADRVHTVVGDVHSRFDGFPIRDFVPIFVERMVRRELGPEAAGTNIEVEPQGSAPEIADATSDARPSTTRDTLNSGGRHYSEIFRSSNVKELLDRNKKVVSAVLAAAVVVVGAVVVITTGGDDPASPTAAGGIPSAPAAPAATSRSSSGTAASPAAAARTPSSLVTVRGVIGSEKQAFFEDPEVVKVFAANGLKVEVDPAGSRQIATSVDLGRYDFAFPSSAPAADRIQREKKVSAKYTPFSSPMAVATFKPIAKLLARAGVVKEMGAGKKGRAVQGFDFARYLELVARGVRWDQLEGHSAYPVRKNVLVSTTDPRTSNSAAMYLAVASYVANGHSIVQGGDAERNVLPALSRLFLGQGYTDNTSEGPFEEYLSVGMGPTPLVWIYEAQFVEAAARGRVKPGMVLMYPSPTVLSRHTLVPFTPGGDRVGRLLSTDPDLQRLAAEHGFRSGDPSRFAKVAAAHKVPVPANLIDVVDTPSYDTLEHLLAKIAKSYKA
ncbi:three-helix bundle dimerization domain-containing protein [Sphaerisporangium fuscum]|uniref:three-helix bundle dimerization domain-containing protein n=1 Tax=Sphaerisporangium fuscum TaxID=2835868 RepID=UPI001BDD0F5D|nr:hypothetical protein [Sphaerisporangium fuscum]